MLSVFKNINKFAGKYKVLDFTAIFFARFLPYLMIAFLAIYSYYISNYSLFIFALSAGILGRLMNEIVHLLYKKQRPAKAEKTNLLIPLPRNYSFPSGHASVFFGISFYLLFYGTNLPLAIFFLIPSFIIGIARVFSGVHWFRDIIGGAIVGAISAIIVYNLINLLYNF